MSRCGRRATTVGRKGLGWGGGVGLAVGLFAPPLLASAAVGAVAGGVIGKFVDHRVEQDIHDKIGENLPPGSAGIIAVFDDEQRLGVEQALAGALLRSVVQGDKQGTGALKESLAEAMGKFSPDRTVLPIPDPNFGGTVGRTLDASVADWTINMTPSPPEGAPNVLLVLIDDAGFGNPSTFGGPVSTPDDDAGRRTGAHVQPLPRHRAVLALPGRAADRPQPPHGGVRVDRRAAGPVPGLHGIVPKDCASFVRALQGNGYSTAGFGKWHLTPDHVQGAAGPFDRWPNAWGFDHFWGILGGEAGQYDPVITQDNTTLGVPEGTDGSEYYWPDDLTDQATKWLHTVRAQDQTKPWFIYYSTGCSHAPHQVAGGVEREVPGQVRPGVGRAARGDVRTAEGAGGDPARRGAHAETRRAPGVGLTLRQREASSTRARWRSTPATRRTPTGTSDGCWTPSRRWASATTRSCSTSSVTTARAWRARSPARSTS